MSEQYFIDIGHGDVHLKWTHSKYGRAISVNYKDDVMYLRKYIAWEFLDGIPKSFHDKTGFLEISQSLQENTCARDFFEISRNTFFTEHLRLLLIAVFALFCSFERLIRTN